MKIGKFFFGLLIGLATITGAYGDDFVALDEALPRGGNAARYAPVFDFDGDGCYPAAGFRRDGLPNGGAGCDGSVRSHCAHGAFLDYSNTLHRWACVEDDTGSYCGHVYELYFEKDQTVRGCGGFNGGHKHDWELVTVWTKDGVITHVNASAHGKRPTRDAADVIFWGPLAGWEAVCEIVPFLSDFCWGYGPVPGAREHAMIVYHKDEGLGGGTHAFRFAVICDANGKCGPKNPYGRFVTPPVISWYHFTGDFPVESNSDFRKWINEKAKDPDSHLNISVIDARFLGELNKHRPSDCTTVCYPEFTQASIEASNPNKAMLTFVEGDGTFSGEDTEYFLDFGQIPLGRHRLIAELAVKNAVYEPADKLDVDFDITAAAPYLCTGCNNFTGLAWGESIEDIIVEIPTAGHWFGAVTGKIVLQPKGLVDTGAREPFEPITMTTSLEIVAAADDGGDGGSNGFGCTMSPNLNQGRLDLALIAIAMIAFIYLGMRRTNTHH